MNVINKIKLHREERRYQKNLIKFHALYSHDNKNIDEIRKLAQAMHPSLEELPTANNVAKNVSEAKYLHYLVNNLKEVSSWKLSNK